MSGLASRMRRRSKDVWDMKPADFLSRPDIAHGICRPCGRRTQVWLPARLCERCLLKSQAWAYACRHFGVVI